MILITPLLIPLAQAAHESPEGITLATFISLLILAFVPFRERIAAAVTGMVEGVLGGIVKLIATLIGGLDARVQERVVNMKAIDALTSALNATRQDVVDARAEAARREAEARKETEEAKAREAAANARTDKVIGTLQEFGAGQAVINQQLAQILSHLTGHRPAAPAEPVNTLPFTDTSTPPAAPAP